MTVARWWRGADPNSRTSHHASRLQKGLKLKHTTSAKSSLGGYVAIATTYYGNNFWILSEFLWAHYYAHPGNIVKRNRSSSHGRARGDNAKFGATVFHVCMVQ